MPKLTILTPNAECSYYQVNGSKEKSDQSLQVAQYCLRENQALCVGVSRAYYAAFQAAKYFLMQNGFTDANYRTTALSLGVNLQNKSTRAFAHETIWDVMKAYLFSVSRQNDGLRMPSVGTALQ